MIDGADRREEGAGDECADGGGSAPQVRCDTSWTRGWRRLTPAERAARGKEARAAVPRDSHAVFDPPPDRPDPIALLEEQAQSRVPELVPVR